MTPRAQVASAEPPPTASLPPGTVDFPSLAPPPAALPQLAARFSPPLSTPAGYTSELEQLLRRRLQIVCVIGACAWVLVGIQTVSRTHRLFNVEVLGWACVVTMFLIALREVVLAACLTFIRSWSLGQLRVIEVFLFAGAGLLIAWQRYTLLGHVLQEGAGAAGPSFGVEFVTAANNLTWEALIVAYGLLIPNTWRRTLVGLAILVLGFLAVDVAVWIVDGQGQLDRYPSLLAWTLTTLAIAVSIAVFGSFKISALSKAVLSAQQRIRELGQYRLKERLGVGGMGEVFLAEHRLLKRPCAIKLIRPERAGHAETLARFEREVQATARLTHPSVVAVFDYGHTSDGTFYYVMEYLNGLSLEELVKRHGPLLPGRAVHLLRQVCGALREAHDHGLVHRDIKPSNILVSRRGGVCDVAKVLDFGLVHSEAADASAQKLTRVGYIVGTPEYMPPEQASNPTLVDARSDVYALGGVLHFTLTGRPPFTGGTLLETLVAHQRDPLPSLTQQGAPVSAELDAIVQRCLAKSPDDRYGSAATVLEALGKCAERAHWSDEQAAEWWQAHLASGNG